VAGIQKISRIIAHTRLDGKIIKYDMSAEEIIKMAEKEKNIHKYKENVFFTSYKTVFNNNPSIMLIFNMKLPGPSNGSSTSSEIVMEIIGMLEGLLTPIDNYEFFRENETDKKNIAYMKVIRKISEESRF